MTTTVQGAPSQLRSRPRRSRQQFSSITHPRRSILLTLVTGLVLVYTLVPLAWLVINASKTQADLFSSFGLWFHGASPCGTTSWPR